MNKRFKRMLHFVCGFVVGLLAFMFGMMVVVDNHEFLGAVIVFCGGVAAHWNFKRI